MTEMKLMRFPLIVIVATAFILGAWGNGFLLHDNTALSNEQTVYIQDVALYNENAVRGSKWHIETVDQLGDVGSYSSIGVDSNDKPHIGYVDLHNRYPKYAFYSDDLWTTADVNQMGLGAQHMSLALDSNDQPHLCYKEDAFVPQLMYSFHDGQKWTFTPVGFQLGHFLSIAVDSNDKAHITSYEYGGSLTYVGNIQGGNADVEIVDQEDNVGQYTAIAVDSNDLPHISYWDLTNKDLKYAYFNGTTWLNETIDSKGDLGYHTSLAIDSNDLPHISYFDLTNNDLKYIYYDGAQWHNETVDSAENQVTSMALDSNDQPHIAYKSNGLKYAFHDGKGWNKETVDSGRDFGEYASIALDSHDNPHISYYDKNNKNLKYAVIDDILPSVIADDSPEIGTTGDSFSFSINAFDNIAVANVHVDWVHGPLDGNISLSKSEGRWVGTIQLSHDLQDLTYTIYLQDATGNFNSSIPRSVTVIDNDLPEITLDNSPETGTTGDIFEFNLSVSDNIEVQSVDITWDHAQSGRDISLDDNNSYWTASVTLDQSVDNLSYIIYINDTSGNIFTSILNIIPVIDNDRPVLLEDTTIETLQTGESFNLSVSVSDNIEVTSVFVRYLFNGLDGANKSMVHDQLSIWELTIVVPVDAINLSCTYFIRDAAGNLKVTDPIIRSTVDTFPPYAKAGDDITIDQHETVSFNASQSFDNGEIENYTWSFAYNGTDFILYGMAADFTFHYAGKYDVELTVTDRGGNSGKDNFSVMVKDITPPKAVAGENKSIGQFEILSLNGGGSTDNAGIVNYTWEFSHNGTNHKIFDMEMSFKFEIPGNYMITLSVKDEAELPDQDSFQLTVRDILLPTANYSIDGKFLTADDVEEIKVNRSVELDGRISQDNVGISNYTWVINGADTEVIKKGATLEFIFNRTGSFTVTLIVSDLEGNTDEKTVNVKIIDEPDDLPDDDGPGTSDEDKEGGLQIWIVILIGIVVVLAVFLLIFLIMRKSGKGKKPDDKTSVDSNVPPTSAVPAFQGDQLNTQGQLPGNPQITGSPQVIQENQFVQAAQLPDNGQFNIISPQSPKNAFPIRPDPQSLELPPPPE